MISHELFPATVAETFPAADTTLPHDNEGFVARYGAQFAEEADRAQEADRRERLHCVAHLLRREARSLRQHADFLACHADHLETLSEQASTLPRFLASK